MMRYRLFLTGSIALLALTGAFPTAAQAQYHAYTSGKPSVEVDLGALGELQPETNAPADYSTYKSAPAVAPVLQVPLAAPSKRILKPMPMPPAQEDSLRADEKNTDFPPPIVEKRAPAPKQPTVVDLPVKKPEQKTVVQPPEFTDMIAKTAQEEKKQKEQIKESQAPSVPVAPPMASIPPEVDDEIAWDGNETPVPPQQEEVIPAPAEPAAVVPSLSDLTLAFDGNSTDISPAIQKKLDDLAFQMKEDISSRLQVRAFAAGEDGTKGSARRTALARALSVRSYLMDKGIKPARVDVRAMGSETDRAPLDRVDLVFMAP